MDNQYDVIVIGAGLGGLTSAATLAQKRKKVLLIERHTIPGGCATIFHRKGVRCEVGLHEMELGKYSMDMKHIIFKKLGLDKTVPFVKLPQTWRVKTETTNITIPHGHQVAKKVLKKEFPNEKSTINTYFRKLNIFAYTNRRLPYDFSFLDFLFYPITTLPIILYNYFTQRTVGHVLDQLTDNEKLKRILNINIAYYHDNPYEFSWQYHASAQAGYYHSAYYIKGGSQVLADELVKVIQKNGGEVRFNCEANAILVENKKAIGVTWYDKKKKQSITQHTKCIIANCAPSVVYEKLLPHGYEDKRLKKLKNSISLYSIYLIFKQKNSTLYPDNTYSTFISTDEKINKSAKEMVNDSREVSVWDRDFVFVDYSTIDSGLVKENSSKSFGVLTGISYIKEWEFATQEEYQQQKEKLAQTLFQRLEKHYPHITQNIEYYEVATPKTIQRYINTPEGTAYGYVQKSYLKNKCERASRLSPTVSNLYFTGAFSFPGGGFTGAIISGYMTAKNILFPFWTYIFLRTLWVAFISTIISWLIINFDKIKNLYYLFN